MSDFLAGVGVFIAAGASAAAILLPAGRARSAAMLLAIGLFPVLILGDQWHSHQIVDLRHHTSRVVELAVVGAIAVAVLAAALRRWPLLLPLAIVAALPFRVPLHAGGESANLLVPLYLVIAGAVFAVLLRDWSAPPAAGGEAGDAAPTGPAGRPVRLLPRVLASVVVLYALQTLYSGDFSK
ncbi:MAG TPA: hypothetical protein VHM66_05680, partial [Solirubrobacterales bacterium]|nr:hypothetical protein [Solirubrobacterales bacterium]